MKNWIWLTAAATVAALSLTSCDAPQKTPEPVENENQQEPELAEVQEPQEMPIQTSDASSSESWNFLVGLCEITGKNSIDNCNEDEIFQNEKQGGLIFYESNQITVKAFAKHAQTGEMVKIVRNYPATYTKSDDGQTIYMQVDAKGCVTENSFQLSEGVLTKIKGSMTGDCDDLQKRAFNDRPDSVEVEFVDLR